MDITEEMIAQRMPAGMYPLMKKARIAIAGAGGLGSNIAAALARCCIGELFITDFDKVEASNLNRQHYRISDIGKYKTEALKEQLLQINPFIKVKTANLRVSEENAAELFGGYDIVCEAFDKAEAKAELANTLLTRTENCILVCGSGMSGAGDPNGIRTRKINDRLYICGDGHTDISLGLTAPRVSICAMHQASTVIEILLQKEKEQRGKK